jgi:SAM-dependent methyltransferase
MNGMQLPFQGIAEYYDGLVGRYGHDPRACDYGRPESQAKKFRVLGEVLDLDGKTLLDVGCGFADFATYLQSGSAKVRYTGIDLSARMIVEARRLHPDLDLRVGNILDAGHEERYDVVSANGVFYLLGENAPELMRRLISKMWELAKVAVAFNSLSTWAPDATAGEFYADPLETVSFCKALTPWIALRHDYHPRDFTVYMFRGLSN